MKRFQQQKGFTLMEIMVVIAILGIIISVGLGSFVSAQKKSRDSRRKSDLRQISNALEAYYNDKGNYPAAAADASGNIMGCGAGATAVCEWGVSVFSNTSVSPNTIYMVLLPKDPLSTYKYYYMRPAATQYKLYARLENTQDTGTGVNQAGYGQSCGAGTCTYGISSPSITP